MAFEPTVVSTEVVAQSPVFRVERIEYEADSSRFTRTVVRHPGAVAVLAFDGTRVAFVRQWRAPIGAPVLEVPAGTRDVEGEAPSLTAERELEEKAGVHAGNLELLCEVLNAPGCSDQRTLIYLATELTTVDARPSGPEESAMDVVWLTLDEALVELSGPGAHDASTVIAVQTLAARAAR